MNLSNNEFLRILTSALEEVNISYDDDIINKFEVYKNLLIEWNEKVNLTSITDDEGIAIKHFVDSVICLKHFDFKNKTMIDVGTGAGFPAIPIKVMEPSVNITLLDSLNKRINFLGEVCSKLNLTNFSLEHGRAEDYCISSGKLKSEFREKYDIAIARAVANLSALLEYCLPFVKVGGYFICLKGPDVEEEVKESKKALETLGGQVENIIKIQLPLTDIVHSIILIRKFRQTPTLYPRKAGTPTKNPIK